MEKITLESFLILYIILIPDEAQLNFFIENWKKKNSSSPAMEKREIPNNEKWSILDSYQS